jgi:Tfp pilus assembly protein PilZ
MAPAGKDDPEDETTKPAPQRAHKRFDVDWRVSLRCKDWGVVSRVAAQNASRGGVFLLTSRPPTVGSEVELVIQLPDGTKAELRGRVQHVVTPERAVAEGRSPGIGVKIDEQHAVDLMLLEQMAAAAEAVEDEMCSVEVPFDDLRQDAAAPDLVQTQPSKPVGRVALQGLTVSRVVGVDFGTSATRVAYAMGERIAVVADEMGRTALPSLVAIVDGEVLVGRAARSRLASDPRHSVSGMKRLIGIKREEPSVAELLQAVSFPTATGTDGEIWVDLDGKRRPLSDMAALVFAAAREQAERQLKRPVREIVLAVPAGFTDGQRAALRQAAQRGGLEVAGLIDEPVAAALSVGAGRLSDETIAVIDLGGGATSVSVLDVAGDRCRIVAHDLDPWLSAADFDTALAQAAADQLWQRTRIELRRDAVAWQRLLLACEDLKRVLSAEPSAVLAIDAIVRSPRPVDLRHRFDRAAFARLCRQLLERVVIVWRRTVAEAGVAPEAIGRILLVGGVARLPFVGAGLAELLGRDVDTPAASDESVASGAALRAATIIRRA